MIIDSCCSTLTAREALLTLDVVDDHLAKPAGLHSPVRDGGADEAVLAETLGVHDVLAGLRLHLIILLLLDELVHLGSRGVFESIKLKEEMVH